MGDANKVQQDACSHQLNGDDLDVVSNGAISNTLSEKLSKFTHSDDLADCLGGKYSVGGLDTFGDGNCAREEKEVGGSADVATLMRCKGTSDEVSIESAIHGEDNLGENHVCLQTAGDSHVCTEGSQEAHLISSPVDQYGGSPTEWEHVLKENFFHPFNLNPKLEGYCFSSCCLKMLMLLVNMILYILSSPIFVCMFNNLRIGDQGNMLCPRWCCMEVIWFVCLGLCQSLSFF
jgi:hypothetical protein